MTRPAYWAYLLFWLVLMALAIGNGVLREATYGQQIPELYAHQLSTAIAGAVFGVSVLVLSKRVIPGSPGEAIAIGFTWLALTLCFEFLFGHYVAGHAWSLLFRDYDLMSGRVWLLLLVWITFLPYLVYKVRK